jgi:hypothetical protein
LRSRHARSADDRHLQHRTARTEHLTLFIELLMPLCRGAAGFSLQP